jgi:hypothetical protein
MYSYVLLEVSIRLKALMAHITDERTLSSMLACVNDEISAVIVLFLAPRVSAWVFLWLRKVVGPHVNLQLGLVLKAVKAVKIGAVQKQHVLDFVVLQFELLSTTADFALERLYL